MKFIETEDITEAYSRASDLAVFNQTIGSRQADPEWVETTYQMPLHLQFAITKLAEESGGSLSADGLDSIPFYSLCRGLFLPLSMLSPERVQFIFGLAVNAPPDVTAKEEMLSEFLDRDVGLTLTEQLGCILGDPFLGKRSTVRRNTLVRLLM